MGLEPLGSPPVVDISVPDNGVIVAIISYPVLNLKYMLYESLGIILL